jgi:hypothetical protein
MVVAENIINSVLSRVPSSGHHLVCDFWSPSVAASNFHGVTFDVILAQNVFAHVDDCHSFIAACVSVMHEDSLLYIQTSQCHMIQNNEFDTIYHEHLSFFSTLSMKTMVESHQLFLNDVFIADIHGDSYLFQISKHNRPNTVITQLQQETTDGIYQLPTYTTYANRCRQVVQTLKQQLLQLQNQGYKLVGYGAAAKGMTVLNFAGLTVDDISYIVSLKLRLLMHLL